MILIVSLMLCIIYSQRFDTALASDSAILEQTHSLSPINESLWIRRSMSAALSHFHLADISG